MVLLPENPWEVFFRHGGGGGGFSLGNCVPLINQVLGPLRTRRHRLTVLSDVNLFRENLHIFVEYEPMFAKSIHKSFSGRKKRLRWPTHHWWSDHETERIPSLEVQIVRKNNHYINMKLNKLIPSRDIKSIKGKKKLGSIKRWFKNWLPMLCIFNICRLSPLLPTIAPNLFLTLFFILYHLAIKIKQHFLLRILITCHLWVRIIMILLFVKWAKIILALLAR